MKRFLTFCTLISLATLLAAVAGGNEAETPADKGHDAAAEQAPEKSHDAHEEKSHEEKAATDKGGFVEVHTNETHATSPATPSVPGGRGVVSSGCLADASVIEDLQRRRADLQAREKELQTRDTELKARERALEEELRKIADVREDIEKIQGARKKEGDEKVAKLVETIETMSPKSASQMMATLDESLAVAAMAKISTPKLAKIMNSMEPRKSARLSELLAGVVRARGGIPASNGAAATTISSAKGGDRKNDGHSEQYDSNSTANATNERNRKEAKREPAGKSQGKGSQ